MQLKKHAQVGTAIEIIGGLLIGTLIIFLFIKIYAAIMGKSDNYYNEFVKKINELKDKSVQEAKDTMPIVLDDGTGILAFNTKATDISGIYSLNWERDLTINFRRPDNCQLGKACLCYCPSFDVDFRTTSFTADVKCKTPRCKSYNNIEFYYNKICQKDKNFFCLYNIGNSGNLWIKKLMFDRDHYTQDDKWQQVAFEKIGNTLVICNRFPCSQEKQIFEQFRLTEIYLCKLQECSNSPFWALREKYIENNTEYYNFYPIKKIWIEQGNIRYDFIKEQIEGKPAPEFGLPAAAVRQRVQEGKLIEWHPRVGIEDKVFEYRENGNPVGHCVIRKIRENSFIQYKINSITYNNQQAKFEIQHDRNIICPTPLSTQQEISNIFNDPSRAAIVEYITQDQISVPPGSVGRNPE